MLVSKRVKYRRVHQGRMKGSASRDNVLIYGNYGIQALEPSWIVSSRIEAAHRVMTRYICRGGDTWIEVFPDKPVTEKPAGTRIDSGKEAPSYWISVVKPGRVLFEVSGISEETARGAVRLAPNKLPIKMRFVARCEEKDGESSEG